MSERFEDVAGTVDVVFDAVGGSTLERSWNILAPGSRLVTIVVVSETAADEPAKRAFFNVQPNAEQLENIRPSENQSFFAVPHKGHGSKGSPPHSERL